MNKAPMSEAWPLLPSDEYDEKGVFSFLTCQLRLVSGVCWDQGRQRSGRDRWSFSHYFLLLSSVISVKKSKQTSACCAECQQKSCCIFLFWSISVRWWTCTYPLGRSQEGGDDSTTTFLNFGRWRDVMKRWRLWVTEPASQPAPAMAAPLTMAH